MTAVKTVNITKNQREERRTSLGKASGEETNPILLSTILRDYRNPLVSTLGAQQRPGVLTKGRGTPSSGSGGVVSPWRVWKGVPRCRVWGLCGSHPIHMGQDPVYTETTHLLFTCHVSCPLRFPASELRLFPWLTCGPFPSLHLVAFT